MKISSARACALRWQPIEPPWYSRKRVARRIALPVRVSTDDGFHGWPEAWCRDAGPTLAAPHRARAWPLIVARDAPDRGVVRQLLRECTAEGGPQRRGRSNSAREACVDLDRVGAQHAHPSCNSRQPVSDAVATLA